MEWTLDSRVYKQTEILPRILESLGFEDVKLRSVPEFLDPEKNPGVLFFQGFCHEMAIQSVYEKARPLGPEGLGVFDAWLRQGNHIWPKLLGPGAMRRILAHMDFALNSRKAALIVGLGPQLSYGASLVSALGFNRIYLVGDQLEDLKKEESQLKTWLLGADIRPLQSEALTLENIGCEVMINFRDLNENQELFSLLAYFNFMSPEGLVVDLSPLCGHENPKTIQSNFLKEADGALLQTVSPQIFEQAMFYEAMDWVFHERLLKRAPGSFDRFLDLFKNST